MTNALRIAVAAVGVFGVACTSGPASAATHLFSARVVHVSTDNIKVENHRERQGS